MPLVIGVTGSIATGKSGLCDRLVERWDAIHSDADKVVHRMYDPGKPAFDRIVDEFGKEIVGEDGFIDRRVLGSKVFGDRERMGKLTRAIGDIAGEIKGVIDGWRADLPEDRIAIMEAVNLIEAGYSAWCDQTWLVATKNENALARLASRDAFSPEEAQQRLDSQRKWGDRAPASDHVFHNDAARDAFLAEVDAEAKSALSRFKAGTLPKSLWFEWREQNPPPQRQRREATAEGS